MIMMEFFVKEFLDYDFSYLAKYLEILKENRNYHFEDNKLKTCWSKNNYLKIFDFVFEDNLKNNILLYKSSLIFIKNSERVKTWIKHTINKNYTNKDRMISLFEYICQLDTETRIESLLYFITKNDSIEDLESFKYRTSN